jgi:acyl carrier protein
MTSQTDSTLVLSALADLLHRICKRERIELSTDTLLADIEGLDSLRLLQTIASLEDLFRVEIEVDALNDLTQVSDILGAIADAAPAPGSGADTSRTVEPGT